VKNNCTFREEDSHGKYSKRICAVCFCRYGMVWYVVQMMHLQQVQRAEIAIQYKPPTPRTDIYTKYRCGIQEVSLANHARINTKPKNEDTTHEGKKTKRKIPINNEHKHCPLNTSTHQISSECLKRKSRISLKSILTISKRRAESYRWRKKLGCEHDNWEKEKEEEITRGNEQNKPCRPPIATMQTF